MLEEIEKAPFQETTPTADEVTREMLEAFTIEKEPIPERTDKNGLNDKWNWIAAHFRITLTRTGGGGKPFVFEYSTGIGNIERDWKNFDRWAKPRGYKGGMRPHYPAPGWYQRQLIAAAVDARTQRNPYRPSDKDILITLCNVHSDGDLDRTFEEFADEYGYSDDSIKAKQIWETCQNQRRELDRVFYRNDDWWWNARDLLDC